jgi:hypothetical protein
MKLENFNDKKILSQFQKEFGQLAETFAEKYGVRVEGNRATYDEKQVSISIKFVAEGVAQRDIQLAAMMEYPALDTEFSYRGESHKVVGYSFTGRTNKIITTNVNKPEAARLNWNAEQLKNYLKK